MRESKQHHQRVRAALGGAGVLAVALATWGLNLERPQGRVWAGQPAAAAHPAANRIIFNRDIRPILSDRCFACHGPDPNKRQAGLRLDRPEAALGALPQHPNLKAFVPGDLEHSEALKRILSTDSATIMPPPSAHRELSDKEKDLIRQWVKQGGDYQEHWAFVTPVRPPLPTVSDVAWPKNDVDRFVLSNLEAQRLKPSKSADKATLIRRASIDLTGIPPTPAEVDAFVADTSPNAYEKVVDRLLASPRYGEQMAVQWLDYARYADSHGFQSDPERHMWLWRDWVIKAFNENMPFDEFTVDQLAGDLLPNATVDQRVATGFNRNHRINNEGGAIAEEWRIEGVIDRVSTTGAVFMGLTLECCRCHDHKYDPITQKEFYALSGYFNSVSEQVLTDVGYVDRGNNVAPVLKVPTSEQGNQLTKLEAESKGAKEKLEALKAKLPEQVAALTAGSAALAEIPGLVARFPLDGALDGAGSEGAKLQLTSVATGKGSPGKDGTAAAEGPATQPAVFVDGLRKGQAARFEGKSSLIASSDAGDFDTTDSFSYGAWVRRKGGGAIMGKMDVPGGFRGFDLHSDGDRVQVHIINHWEDLAIRVRSAVRLPANEWKHVMATYDGSGKAAGVRIYIDGRPVATEILNDTLKGTIKTASRLRVGSRDGGDYFSGDVADARVFSKVLSPSEVGAVARGDAARAALAVAPASRSKEQADDLLAFVEATDGTLSAAAAEAMRLAEAKSALEKQLPDVMVMEDLPKPRDTFVLLRGEYDKHGDKVANGTPAVLPPLAKDAPPNRLGLARWIVDPANPLTSRVQANRLWEKFFGVGLVKTSENLGTQTEWPSNPELLDFLASEMVRLKWDLKAFQKTLVMSAAYQQSSDISPELLELDPENRLVARGPRFRMTAEQIRDSALAASGLLVEKVGGPSVRPYGPADLWAGNLYGNLKEYVAGKGADVYRRSLYTFIKRTANPANLSMFDQPSREYCVIRRSRTNTPLQALDLMNDPTYLEASRVLAEKVLSEVKGGTGDRVAEMFRRVTGRAPTESERSVLVKGLESSLARFKADPESAAAFLKVGNAPGIATLDPAELAAYSLTSSVILNLDESVTRQ